MPAARNKWAGHSRRAQIQQCHLLSLYLCIHPLYQNAMSIPVPPSWKDLGKAASDILGKDYPIHGSTLEVKTRTPSGVTFLSLIHI